jgi:hypothetical protein
MLMNKKIALQNYKRSNLEINPNAIDNLTDNAVVVEDDHNTRIIAVNNISKGTIISTSQPLLSFDRGSNEDDKSLTSALFLTSDEIKLTLLSKLFRLFPRTDEDYNICSREFISRGLKEFNPERFRDIDEEMYNNIIKQPEHAIRIFIQYNHFRSQNKRYLYFLASFFNHSCNPNCVWIFNDDNIEISAIRDINNREECTITYWGNIFTLDVLETRRKFIKDIGGFNCICSYCLSDDKRTRCYTCGQCDKILMKCGKCILTSYCGKECQTIHWKLEHKYFCGK